MQNGWDTDKKQGQPLSGIALIPYYIYRTFASFAPHALKGQKLLAQGIALGVIAISKSPCKGKSFINSGILKLLPLQGDKFVSVITQGVALG